MKSFCKILCILLCLVFVLSAVSCKPKQSAPGNTTEAPEEDTSPYDANGYLKDRLPRNLNYNNEEICILHWSDAQYMEFGEIDTSIPVSKAIVNRNFAVESRLNVALSWDSCPGGNGVYTQFTAKVQNDIMADRTYDIYAAYAPELGILTTHGYTKNLLDDDMTYLNMESPWWPDSLIEYCTYGNKLYFASGDISTNLFYVMNGIYYNQDLLTTWGVQADLYQLVKDGDWTLDQLLTICKSVEVQNNNGATDTNVYGFVTAYSLVDGFYVGSGLETVVKSEDNQWKLSTNFSGQKAHSLYEQLGSFLNSDIGYNKDDRRFSELFPSKRSLFMGGQIGYAITYLGDVSFEYRVVPYPKYDTAQTDYYTAVGNYFSMYGVSANCYGDAERAERISAVLECYASEAYRKTTPVLFEETFKLRYSKDAKESEMFDYIRNGVRFDLGQIHNAAVGLPYNIIREFVYTGGSEFSSTVARTAWSISNQIGDLMDVYEALP